MFNRLGDTVNSVNTTFLTGGSIPPDDARAIARFIASRQGLPGCYPGLFAPMPGELDTPYVLFTGEPTSTGAAGRHILGEECLRILRILNYRDPDVTAAIDRAQTGFAAQLDHVRSVGYSTDTYCCGKCTIAYWRTLLTNWLPDPLPRIARGMPDLEACRLNGKWRRYPFYYTVLCLTEIPIDIARNELDYIRPACERALKRQGKSSRYANARSIILHRALNAL